MFIEPNSEQGPFPVGYQEIDQQLGVAEVHQDRFKKATIRLGLVILAVIAITSFARLVTLNRLFPSFVGALSLGLASHSFHRWWQLGTLHLASVQTIIEPLRQYWHIIAYRNGWRESAYAEDIVERFYQFEIAGEGDEWGKGPGSVPLRISWMWTALQAKRKQQ